MSGSGTSEWHVPFLSPQQDRVDQPIALIFLNEPVDRGRVKQVWARASLIYFADGGANRVFDALDPAERPRYLPTLIKGDLDSLRDDVRAYYEEQGVKVVLDGDQYATDLQKCIVALREAEVRDPSKGEHALVIVGGLTGRFDQTAHTIHTLHKLRGQRKRTWVVSDNSLACLLDSGKHLLHLDRKVCGPACGLLPIGVASARLTTQGLEWNLDSTLSAFGGDMLSTSNHLAADSIQVETNAPIIFSVELQPAEVAPLAQDASRNDE